MKYTNNDPETQFTGTYREICAHLNASLPRAHPERWPGGPWTIIDNQQNVDYAKSKRNELKRKRIELSSLPINNVQVATKEDRENIQGAIDNWSLLGNPSRKNWIMADNSISPLTRSELISILQEYVLRKDRLFTIYGELIFQIQNGADPDSVNWPE